MGTITRHGVFWAVVALLLPGTSILGTSILGLSILGMPISAASAQAGGTAHAPDGEDRSAAAKAPTDPSAMTRPPATTIYVPSASFQPGTRPNKVVADLEDLLKRLSLPARLEMMPVRRAVQQYRNHGTNCLLAVPGPIAGDEIASRPLYVSRFYLYVRTDAGLDDVGDLKAVGTIVGADTFVDLSVIPHVSWRFAPSYDALVSMVVSGRVDAVTLGPRISEGHVSLPGGIGRLQDKPFFELLTTVRCKNSGPARALVAAIEEAWGDLREN